MRRLLLPLLALAVVVLVACGSDSDSSSAKATPEGGATRTAAPASTAGAAAGGGVRLVGVGKFDAPVYVTSPPADKRRLFVVQQGGLIRVVRGGRTLPKPFLDLRDRVVSGGEQGLLSIAFPPDYAKSKRFYVYYTAKGAGTNTIAEFRAGAPDRAVKSSARVLLSVADREANHNGGLLQFGPDGLLYTGLGDGGGGNDQHGERGNAQNLGALLGKILRIDPRASGGKPYSIPSSNPFVGRAGARGEIYAFGLRNPWRYSFDRSTDDLVIGDVGQDEVEEIDFLRKGRTAGANFGWRPFEGTRKNFDEPAPDAVSPVLQFQHSNGYCSITGGYIVRDPALTALKGKYVYGDFCEGHIRAARLSAGKATGDKQLALPRVSSLSSFGQDSRGRIYVVSLDGAVSRLAAK